jgi:hypothetical protein
MLKKILLLALFLAPVAWSQNDASTADRLARKKGDEDQRQDEYANSLRRRDWLKDRLIVGPGLGSKYSVMGKSTFGFGAAVEYITQWHVAPFLSYGLIFKSTDPAFEDYSLQGGSGGRVGLTYYLFPKSPLHLGISVSYGTVYFDHGQQGDTVSSAPLKVVEPIILCKGWEGDLVISYLTNEWYFLNFVVGAYYAGPKLPGTKKLDYDPVSFLEEKKKIYLPTGGKAIPDYGLVFGAGIGFALADLFPDATEIRRRKREDTRN